MGLIQRWMHSFQYHEALDILLRQAPGEVSDLRVRLDWLGRLVNWVRTAGPQLEANQKQPERIQTTRLKYILQVLDRDPDLKSKVSHTLRSIIYDTRALELFMHVGVPNQQGFIGEFIERLNLMLLPQAPQDQDLISVFSETFRFESDAEWIRFMDPVVFKGWVTLFTFSGNEKNAGWNKLILDAEDALFLISDTVSSIGLSRLVRNRVKENDFRKLPFFELTLRTENFLSARNTGDVVSAYVRIMKNIRECFATLDEVQTHFKERGTSVELVYQISRLKSLLRRIETLVKLLANQEQDSEVIQEFIGHLIRENLSVRKISKLLKDNLVLLAQKVIETNAETGEHYITRDRNEHWEILKSAWGGGLATGLTTLFKNLLSHLSAPPFISGLFSFANYSVSFLGMQATGLTLATKQPAMTAATLASKIEESDDSVGPLTDELIHLVRSQVTAVMGNIWGVIPAVMLIDFIYTYFGSHLMSAEKAEHTLQSFSLLGPTPFYAAGTGVLLWLSSIFAGWFANWFSFRGLPEAIEHHHRMRYVLGKERTKRISEFFRIHIGGIASNLSLAFLLSMTPLFASFFGLPFDVRHVTLSSGALTASTMVLGGSVFSTWGFWLAVGGIISMAILNLTVSFSLALIVAIWAKKVSGPKRSVIYRALLKKFIRKPWIFFLVPKRIS